MLNLVKIYIYSQVAGLVKQPKHLHTLWFSLLLQVQHKSWVLILLGSNINIIVMLNSIVCCKAEPQDVGLYEHKLELFDMCQ